MTETQKQNRDTQYLKTNLRLCFAEMATALKEAVGEHRKLQGNQNFQYSSEDKDFFKGEMEKLREGLAEIETGMAKVATEKLQ